MAQNVPQRSHAWHAVSPTSRRARSERGQLPLRQDVLAALLILLAMEGDDEVPGLGKGPANPADIGTRCAVLAGREDRGYLDCARQAPPSSTSRGRTPAEPVHPGPSGGTREGTARRYPLRGR
jgi:hypothetical protein